MADFAWLTARPIAHRGLHDIAAGRLENTLPAAAAAIEHGFAIECDVGLSSDGEAMVFHDDTLDRLTNASGPVAALSAADLVGLTLKGTDARIPSLADLLDLIAGRVPLVIELKSTWAKRGRGRDVNLALVRRVAAVIENYAGPVALMSFDPDIVEELPRAAPTRPHGIVADRATDARDYPGLSLIERFGLRHLLHVPRTRPAFVAYDVHALPMITPLILRKLFRTPLLTWTVRTPGELAVARANADQIIFEGFVPTP